MKDSGMSSQENGPAKGRPEGGEPKAGKTESKWRRIVRNIVTTVLMLAFLVFFIILFAKKCSGQI